ncbi:hypothetical protein VUR80DRAFT_357 [Thermomyces stellatus]
MTYCRIRSVALWWCLPRPITPTRRRQHNKPCYGSDIPWRDTLLSRNTSNVSPVSASHRPWRSLMRPDPVLHWSQLFSASAFFSFACLDAYWPLGVSLWRDDEGLETRPESSRSSSSPTPRALYCRSPAGRLYYGRAFDPSRFVGWGKGVGVTEPAWLSLSKNV